MKITVHVILTIPNSEDPEVGGFFAFFADCDITDPGWGRGFGFTRYEAIVTLVRLKAEQDEEIWYEDTRGD